MIQVLLLFHMWLNFEMLNLDCKDLLSLNTLIMIRASAPLVQDRSWI